MPCHPVVVPVIAALLAGLVGGCSSDGNAYDSLSQEASDYVIPGSEDWGSGRLCPDGGDCAGDATVSVNVWGQDVADVEDVLAERYEIWTGVDPEANYAVVFVAVDAEGRFAGVGDAAAEYFTVPVARLPPTLGHHQASTSWTR